MALLSNIDNEILISLVQSRPVLWNKTLDRYKDKVITKNEWTDICEELFPGFGDLSEKKKNEIGKEVRKRWWNIRDNFVKSRKKHRQSTHDSAAAPSNQKKSAYYGQLKFLIQMTEKNELQEVKHEDGPEDGRRQEAVAYAKPRKRKLEQTGRSTDRHLSFFRGIIPSLENFDEDEIVEFQMGVLQIIASIKQQKRINEADQ